MGVRAITVYVLGDGTGLTRVLNRATVDLDRFVADTEKKGGRLADVLGSGLTKGLAAAGVGLAAGLGLAAAAAVPFEAAMRNVNSIATQSEAQFAATEQAVLALSTTVPQSATTLAKGLYEITSTGFSGADAMNVLGVSAKAASAGLSDSDTAARAITGALKAYGLSAASAGDVSDILFQTVKVGVVSFEDLAQQMGDFIGIASAAKVPLQDVSAAFAAVTLSGIPAAEAATGVKQLIANLVKPGKDMAAVFKDLGYQSGAAALQQKGLAGVMDDLRKVTGGSADQVIRLFRDIRAGNAAIALFANSGKNYRDSIDQVANSSARTGATQRAFAEQMKSTAAQLALFRNDAEALAISIGLKVLPAVGAFLTAARDAGATALPYVEAALHRVAPLFEQLWNIAGNLARILLDLAKDAAPFAVALAKIGAAVAVPPLMLFLRILEAVTGFLADHQGIVLGVAAVYAAQFIPALIDAGIGLAGIVTRTVLATFSLQGYVNASLAAEAATNRFKASVGLAEIAVTAGLGVALLALTNTIQNITSAQDDSQAAMAKFRKEFVATDFTHTATQLDQLNVIYHRGQAAAKEYGSAWGQVKAVFNSVAGDGSIQRILQQGDDAKKTIDAFAVSTENAHENLTEVAKTTGLTTDALGRLARAQNIDLSGTFDSSADARKRLIEYVGDLKHAQDIATASFVAGFGKDVEAAAEAEKAVQKFADAAQQAFQKDTDVLGNFDPASDAKKVADAQTALAKARRTSGTSGVTTLRDEQRIARDRQAVQDAEQRAAVSHTRTLSGHLSRQQAIARARRRLADDEALIKARGTGGGTSSGALDAEARLSEARQAAADNTLQARYRRAIQLGKDFTRDINQAVQRGLDPNVIGKLLTEGPAKAEPALQRILADHTGNLIKMVNASEAQIANLSGYVAEQARIAARAMNAPTDQYTKDLKSAMALAAAEAASGGRATMDALVRSLHLPRAAIRRIAHEFGITISDQVQAAVNANPITVPLSPQPRARPNIARDALRGVLRKPRAEGGPVDWGPPGRDQVPAWVTRGEWVQPKAAVDYYGQAFHEAVRTRTFPKLWDGGLVDAGGSLISSVLNVAGPRIVPVPVPVASRSSTDNSLTYNIDRVMVGSLDQLPRGEGRTYSAARGVT